MRLFACSTRGETLYSEVDYRAGDAFLSISALCAVQQAPMEIVGFVGNAAGAQAVSVVCHERPVERAGLFKQIEALLK